MNRLCLLENDPALVHNTNYVIRGSVIEALSLWIADLTPSSIAQEPLGILEQMMTFLPNREAIYGMDAERRWFAEAKSRARTFITSNIIIGPNTENKCLWFYDLSENMVEKVWILVDGLLARKNHADASLDGEVALLASGMREIGVTMDYIFHEEIKNERNSTRNSVDCALHLLCEYLGFDDFPELQSSNMDWMHMVACLGISVSYLRQTGSISHVIKASAEELGLIKREVPVLHEILNSSSRWNIHKDADFQKRKAANSSGTSIKRVRFMVRDEN